MAKEYLDMIKKFSASEKAEADKIVDHLRQRHGQLKAKEDVVQHERQAVDEGVRDQFNTLHSI